MSIKVMIKRKWLVEKPEELLPLLAALRAAAREQPGFISGETLRSIDNPENFLIISIWETADDWKQTGRTGRQKIVTFSIQGGQVVDNQTSNARVNPSFIVASLSKKG